MIAFLSWMAQYAAYCIDQLRMQGSFYDLLAEVPVLSSRIVLSLKSASDAPWDIEEPKGKYPQYNLALATKRHIVTSLRNRDLDSYGSFSGRT